MVLLSLLLVACGGGGGDSGGSSGGVTTPAPVTPVPSNSAPKLTLSVNSLIIDELASETLAVTISDAETANDGLTVSISSSNQDLLSATYAAGVVSLTAEDVSGDQVVTLSVVVSDGAKSSTATVSITIIDTSALIPPPSIRINGVLPVAVDQTISINYAVIYDESASFKSESVTSTDASVLTVSIEEQTLKVTGVSPGQAAIAYEVTDSNNNKAYIEVDIEVLSVPAPMVTLGDISEAYLNNRRFVTYSVVYADNVSAVSAEVSTSDESILIATIKDDKIELTGRALGQASFTYTTTDSNGAVGHASRTVNVIAGPVNSAPIITLVEKVGPYTYVPEGTTKTFNIVITDDKPENVALTDVTFWFGEESQFEASLDADSQTITINNHSVALLEDFGVLVSYDDGNYGGQVGFLFKSSAVLGDLENEVLDYIQVMNNKVAALQEYIYVAEFYSQVLENTNKLTTEEAQRLIRQTRASDTAFYYGFVKDSLMGFQQMVILGALRNDEDLLATQQELIAGQFGSAILFYLQDSIVHINELAELSNGLLPLLSFEEELQEYDVINNHFSRFAGNETYGEYVNGVWVFKAEYNFMKAIVSKTLSQISPVYPH